MTSSFSTSEPLIDLQQLVAGVRWRYRIWLATGLIGVILGVAAAIAMPSVTAVAGVLVAHERGTSAQFAVSTDSSLAQSTAVAGAALRNIGTSMSAAEFLSTYGASSLKSGEVLVFTLRAPSEDEALERLQALADAYISFHVGLVKETVAAEAQALTDRRTRAEEQLAEIDRNLVNRTGPADQSARSNLGARTAFETEIRRLNQQLQDVGNGLPAMEAGTKLVDGPRLQSSLKKTLVMNAAIGLLLGLALGGLLALVATVVRDRPVLRREIAANLGASVIAQLPTRRGRLAFPWLPKRPAAESERVAATLGRLLGPEKGSVSLLGLGCADTVAALAVDVANGLAGDHPVLVIDDLPGRDVIPLVPGDSQFRVADGTAVLPPASPDELRIGVGTVAPGTPWTDLTRLGERTVLVVAAGSARKEWLHTVARQLADLRIQVIGTVLVNPDPRDRSDGTLWDSLHTALRADARTSGRPSSVRPDEHGSPVGTYAPVLSPDARNGHST